MSASWTRFSIHCLDEINLNRLVIASKKFVIFSQVLVHGEQNEMGRLKAALIREYEDNPVSYARAMFCKY